MLPLLEGRRVALIDDVVSSGASMEAALQLMTLCKIEPVAIGAAMLQSERWRERLAALDPKWPSRIVAVLRTPILARAADGKWRDAREAGSLEGLACVAAAPAANLGGIQGRHCDGACREMDGLSFDTPPVDDLIDAAKEVRIRQDLTLVALGKRPADKALRVGRLLDVHTRTWREDWEIVIKGRRIAWVGPAGEYQGEVAERFHEPGLSAVPGFGEVHKHIESSHLTPEWEAALVLPRGNTWTCEASHEFSNVNGPRNLEFWLEARKRGSPLKIFPLPGSAVPPTAYEWGGGYFGRDEQRDFMAQSLMVAGLDEVMDWPAVWNPENPSYERLWGMIEATFAARGVVEGHASGLRDAASINAFAAGGPGQRSRSADAEETWDKLARGLFIELRIYAMPEIIKFLLDKRPRATGRRSPSPPMTAAPHIRWNSGRAITTCGSRSRAGSRPRSRSNARRSTRRGTCG